MLYTLLENEITQKLTKIINLLNKCDRKTLKLLFIFSCPYNNLKNVFFPFLFFKLIYTTVHQGRQFIFLSKNCSLSTAIGYRHTNIIVVIETATNGREVLLKQM